MNQWFMGPRPNAKYKIWLAYLIQISEERHNNSLSFIFIAQLFSGDSVSILGLILRERIDCSHHRWQIPSRLLIILEHLFIFLTATFRTNKMLFNSFWIDLVEYQNSKPSRTVSIDEKFATLSFNFLLNPLLYGAVSYHVSIHPWIQSIPIKIGRTQAPLLQCKFWSPNFSTTWSPQRVW